MRYFFALFCFCALTTPALAQVSRPTFVNAVNQFNTFENARNGPGAINQFDAITGLINSQIFYLDTKIVQAGRKYQADSTKAYTDMRNAQSSPDPNSPQLVNARNEVKLTTQELEVIHEMVNQQNAYKSMLVSLQPLRTNILTNKTAINTIYTSFLQTLP